jgi:hypothetical protein
MQYLNQSVDTLQTYVPRLIVEPIRWTAYQPIQWDSNALSIQSITETSVSMYINGYQCLQLALIMTPLDNSAMLSVNLSSFYQTSQLLSVGNIPAPYQVSQLILLNPTDINLNGLINETLHRVQYILYRPEFEISLTQLPTTVSFSTLRIKEPIDLRSIYIKNSQDRILQLLLLTIALLMLQV